LSGVQQNQLLDTACHLLTIQSPYVVKKIKQELTFTCLDTAASILSSKETSALSGFDWKLIADEVK